ncbi:MAG: aspartate/glutamate racemase family protein [Phycisphaerales bacterium]
MDQGDQMKTLGILAHSAEGGGLCFLAACREGGRVLGEHLHPPIVLSCLPMAWSMPAWRGDDHEKIGEILGAGVRQLAAGGADFFVCPDNTAHIVLEQIAAGLPIPGLHIARVVCEHIAASDWSRVGLLGTEWTMSGEVYARELAARGMERLIPDREDRAFIDHAIFSELCNGVFEQGTTERFLRIIGSLRERGAECVVLGCTEIPLIVNDANSPLPVLDSTRLLAHAGVAVASRGRALEVEDGWVRACEG